MNMRITTNWGVALKEEETSPRGHITEEPDRDQVSGKASMKKAFFSWFGWSTAGSL